jgi:translation initiation factor IF-2
MAKKRVHEIAKEKGIPSKEVLAILQKAGYDVKAAASSVDEEDIARAFGDGAAEPEPAPARPAPKQDGANGAPPPAAARPPREAPSAGDGGDQGADSKRARPTRGARGGESGGGGGGRRRRVVIDSQAGGGARPPPPPRGWRLFDSRFKQ